ncbi:PVC-type heme-binding CxxCH protein [Spirosoma validum]|uniref:HEAT repeat domain-containing protein n=1 Tax=Spirosoma validum TaxID=2771355 RepID=A0A927AYV6_9BACT|nr:PVC-type heme-binding CxxCH protein [Spirosoma validum]MBD2752177.1 HEAT repeat domain-containing protein [Spirosoma validum]
MKSIFSLSPLPVALTTIGFLYLTGQPLQLQQVSATLPNATQTYQQRNVVSSDSSKLYVPDDLEATLWAESPMFYNPTNMDIDAKGRIWITEAVNYRKFNNKAEGRLDHPEGERIVILEDTNGDGKADDSKVFVTDPDLVSPLGIAVIGNKVIVSAAPNIVVYIDENGDDKPDKKEVMLSGFGGTDHDHSLHSVVAGPDGKYYFNTGNAGPHVVSDKDGWTLRSGSMYVGGTPYNKINHGNQVSDDGRVWVGGLALRINADGSNLKVMAQNFRNNYETALDSYGNMWQNDNDDEVMACRTSWLMEGANAGYFSADGTRNWKGDQRPGQSIPTAHWHQEDPGVMPVGDLTGAGSPTGMVVYEGDELGLPYRGMLLSAEAGRNVIFGYKPELSGAGYRMPRTDFISTFPKVDENYKWNDVNNDSRKWFRPSDVTVGTDGAIYVADWYDPIVGGHQMKDRQGYGRIYRITPKGKNLKAPKIDLRSTQGQIAALLNPAVNVRMLGFDALQEQGEKVIAPVMALLTSPNPYHRARAIFLLVQLGGEGQFEVERLLKSDDPMTRITALRALRSITPENNKSNPGLTTSQEALLPLLGNLSLDRNAAVRREVAVALRDIPYAECRVMLKNLVNSYDGKDRWYLNALSEAADGKEENLFADLTLPDDPIQWDQRTADLMWEFHPAAAVGLFKKRAESQALSADARRQAITSLAFIKNQSAAKAMLDLSKSSDKDVADQANYWLDFRRGNDWAKFLNWDEVKPVAVSSEEQRMLAKRKELLDDIKTEAEKRKLAIEMSKDPEGAKILIGLAAEKKLSDDLIKAAGPGIRTNKDQTVRMMGKEDFPWKRPNSTATNTETASVSTTSTQQPSSEKIATPVETVAKEPTKTPPVSTVPVQATNVETPPAKPAMATTKPDANSPISQIAMLTGDERNGRTLFKTNCATCHRHGQQGEDIGPDLSKIHQKLDKSGLLEAIVYPNAGIAFGYEPYMIMTKTGQTYYGFLVSDGEQSVVIKGIKGIRHTIPADKISSRRQYKNSLMPDPNALGLNQQQLADLAAFLLKQ